MKQTILFVLVWLAGFLPLSAQKDLAYFLPSAATYDPKIPTPESFFGFQVGEYHLTPANILRYMETLDRVSDRVSLVRIGESWEKQPLVQLIVTSPANQQNLEPIRQAHLAALDPSTKDANGDNPLVIWLGYSVHGNEPSGANASTLVAYYLAACQDEEVVRMLDQAVILIDPFINPDGLNRFSSWVNTRKSLNNNPDPNSFEFQEPWPGGRTNHYWFDLNRDWLLQQQPETRALVDQFHRWMPNLVTDHHEMGSNSTFFFQPGVPERNNPMIPKGNYALTQKIGTYHAKALDRLGSLYYTGENYDDFYFGKGSTYPDIEGSIGILFEQASSRGHLRQTDNGLLSFPFTIRNQVTVSLSSMKAASDLKKELQYYMADFYRNALKEGQDSPVKGYVFGDSHDPYRSRMMLDILLRHRIEVRKLNQPAELDGYRYHTESAWFVPTAQAQYRLVRTLFETETRFPDSTFYDVSAWTLPLAMGIPFSAVDARTLPRLQAGDVVSFLPEVSWKVPVTENPVGYLIPCDAYLIHKALYQILSEGLRVKISTAPFTMNMPDGPMTFGAGTLLVPARNQSLSGADILYVLNKAATGNGISVYPAPTGYTPEGPDLGSGKFAALTLPKILAFAESGSSSITGEAWYLFDTRFSIPMTICNVSRFNSIDPDDYTVILFTGPTSLDHAATERLSQWVRKGGTVIGIGSGCSYLSSIGLARLTPVERAKPSKAAPAGPRPYADKATDREGNSIPGTIFLATLDTTHPLAYGYHSANLAILKESMSFYQPDTDVYENPAVFTANPLLSGYVNSTNLGRVRGSSAIQRQRFGSGRVILFFDDPLFRGYWAGMHKLFLNALFWGNIG